MSNFTKLNTKIVVRDIPYDVSEDEFKLFVKHPFEHKILQNLAQFKADKLAAINAAADEPGEKRKEGEGGGGGGGGGSGGESGRVETKSSDETGAATRLSLRDVTMDGFEPATPDTGYSKHLVYFVPGFVTPTKVKVPARGYFSFRGTGEGVDFIRKLHNRVLVTASGLEQRIQAEFALYQKFASRKNIRRDGRVGTIGRDASFKAFLKQLEEKKEAEAKKSAEGGGGGGGGGPSVELGDVLEEKKNAAPTETPSLVKFLLEKHNKAKMKKERARLVNKGRSSGRSTDTGSRLRDSRPKSGIGLFHGALSAAVRGTSARGGGASTKAKSDPRAGSRSDPRGGASSKGVDARPSSRAGAREAHDHGGESGSRGERGEPRGGSSRSRADSGAPGGESRSKKEKRDRKERRERNRGGDRGGDRGGTGGSADVASSSGKGSGGKGPGGKGPGGKGPSGKGPSGKGPSGGGGKNKGRGSGERTNIEGAPPPPVPGKIVLLRRPGTAAASPAPSPAPAPAPPPVPSRDRGPPGGGDKSHSRGGGSSKRGRRGRFKRGGGPRHEG